MLLTMDLIKDHNSPLDKHDLFIHFNTFVNKYITTPYFTDPLVIIKDSSMCKVAVLEDLISCAEVKE